MNEKPAKPREGHFLIVEDDQGKKVVLLQNQAYSLGRAPDCDIRVRSQFVSRRHATLLKQKLQDDKAYYQIADGDPKGNPSANGLLVNGQKVASHTLKHGDKIVFGPQVLITYQYRQYINFPTLSPDDPFDITLIDPAMMLDELGEENNENDIEDDDEERTQMY